MGDLAASARAVEEECAPPARSTPFDGRRASFSIDDELDKPSFSRRSAETDGLLARDQNGARQRSSDGGGSSVVFESASALAGDARAHKGGLTEYLEELYRCGLLAFCVCVCARHQRCLVARASAGAARSIDTQAPFRW